MLNDRAYAYHYRNLDSTTHYALMAREEACRQHDRGGQAEAVNHQVFVCIARMEYQQARQLLDSIPRITDSQIELLVAYIQQMRLCQRESRNKEFYEFYEQAKRALARIDEDGGHLSPHQQRRMVYARTEMAFVVSTYYYYVGLEQQSAEELLRVDKRELESDTAQYLNYLYQTGAGGIIHGGSPADVAQKEWESLMHCYQLATLTGDAYWLANSMQALSEHLSDERVAARLMADNRPALALLNSEGVADDMLAGYLAETSLELFRQYGDVYQMAGSYRTLASCFWMLGDYNAAGFYLEKALSDTLIYQAPDLVASIRERLSLTYSAIDEKALSDENRTIYIDLQEQTRQDRQLEARADQLARSSRRLNVMIVAVVAMILLVAISIVWLNRLRRRRDNRVAIDRLMQPLSEWEKANTLRMNNMIEQHEEVNEALQMSQLHLQESKRQNVENRAKVFLVNSITPLIDRMGNEIRQLRERQEEPSVRDARYRYVAELTQTINDYNAVLTQWIQMRQGQLSLKIETFPLNELFDIVARSRMSFQLKGIGLIVQPTDLVVKADRILTLFMLNTLADNARKFTQRGGEVTVSCQQGEGYVEISVEDNGQGMGEEQLTHLFDRKQYNGHGFGLMNCKGIIDKYRKTSQLFSVCAIGAESAPGKGSRFYFRLPQGVKRVARGIMAWTALVLSLAMLWPSVARAACTDDAERATQYADSTYQCNIGGRYAQAMLYADSALQCISRQVEPQLRARDLAADGLPLTILPQAETAEPPELAWYHAGIRADYDLIVYLRNEIAVAALARHQWETYRYNNRLYTSLYKELSADNGLGDYVQTLQRQESNQTIAVALLVLMLVALLVAYYMLYYRHRIYYRICLDRVKRINEMLLSDASDSQKLQWLADRADMPNMPEELQRVVNRVKEALMRSVETEQKQQLNIELARDELRRTDYESSQLHVSNNVLDNCLSTLKHETMYYPSRINQLIDGTDQNLEAIAELLAYYKELYAILSQQAMRQVEHIPQECRTIQVHEALGPQYVIDHSPLSIDHSSLNIDHSPLSIDHLPLNIDHSSLSIDHSPLNILSPPRSESVPSGRADHSAVPTLRGDATMLRHLFALLLKLSGKASLQVQLEQTEESYVRLLLPMPWLPWRDFFVPSMPNIPLLVCRQILRDNSQTTHLRGCGIVAEPLEGGTLFRLTMAQGRTIEKLKN